MISRIHALIGCYFVASFAALGLPPYLTEILPRIGDPRADLAGVLYVVPTVFAAVSAPLWGRLADRFGPRSMLLRAQIGLALAFILAGLADNIVVLALALMLQGILGGTYAATQAYLGGALATQDLGKALVLLQGAARAALLIAPLAVGVLSRWVPPQHQYLWFAMLPAAAAILVATLPRERHATQAKSSSLAAADVPRWLVSVAEFGFVLATVVTYPYFLRQITSQHPSMDAIAASALFALPHVLYLLSAGILHAPASRRPLVWLRGGMLGVACGAASIAFPLPLILVVASRIVIGLGMAACLVALANLAARSVQPERSGRTFGVIELCSKLGAVAAGLIATTSAVWHPSASFIVGAVVAFVFAAALPSQIPAIRRRTTPTEPAHLHTEQK